ncbi:ATP-binding protein [Candidatus Phytoplasma fraxini]|uniref:DUF234 domain-containing protein n=1 Tax=Ash yellows phytoplasma TaxID=35780 RepID=A0ABZ2U8I1_ASHYP
MIDEFSYLVDKNLDFLTILQNIVDNMLKNSQMKLFISGSHMSLMEQMDNYSQGLYRRINYKKKLQPFFYDQAALFYPKMKYLDRIKLYSIFGGLPYYLTRIDDSKSIKDNILNIALPEMDFTENEIYNNLLQEIRMPAPYLEILDVLADKKEVKLTTINKKIEKSSAHTSILLKKLLNLEIIYKVICFGEKENSKKTFYRIQDPFIRFYYRFIKKYYRQKYYFQNKEDFYNQIIAPDLEHFVSWEFENICKHFLIQKYHGEVSRFLY